MALPTYGAAPLAKTFILVRGVSLVALLSIVGITANFVAEIINSNVNPPQEVLGTLVITCIATLYCLLSLPFFWSNTRLGLCIMTGLDALLLLAFAIVSVLLGKTISFLNCAVLQNYTAAASSTSAYDFSQSLTKNMGLDGSTLSLNSWAGNTVTNCYETKAIWGLCIALCILFSCSAVVLPALWWRSRASSTAAGKSQV